MVFEGGIAAETIEELVREAKKARERSYAPYSDYRVGAALLGASGGIHSGCNVENASFGLTLCAERVAAANAVLHGDLEFKALAVVSDDEPPATPCGACRQVLSELAPRLLIVTENLEGHRLFFALHELIPHLYRFEKK